MTPPFRGGRADQLVGCSSSRLVADLLDPEQDDGDVVPTPGRVGLGDQLVCAAARRSARPPRISAICSSEIIEVSPSLHSRSTSPARTAWLEVSTSTVGLGPECAGDDRPLRMLERLLVGQLAALNAAPRPASDPASAAAARRRGTGRPGCPRRGRSRRSSAVVEVGRGQRRTHSGAVAIAVRELVDLPVGLLRGDLGEPLLRRCRSSGSPCSNTSTAIFDATSPAWAPPIPSATTNTGARAYEESSLPRRWRPVSVRWTVSAARSTITGGRRTRSRRFGSDPPRAAVAVRSTAPR